MINREFETVGLYEHNADSYNTVKGTYDIGEDIVGIVHATGTGKSYNALQLTYDNKDKKIVYVVPSNGIIEHIKNIIDSNPNLDMLRDFPNLEFRTYQSFISLSTEEISDIDCDLLILDEFHHIGAPVWGSRINTLIETHPDIKVFGMTAYTVRDRGTSYERDMANPDTDELFSGKIVSRYDLCDAMIDGVLPKPIYKSAYTNLIGLERNLEERVQKLDATPNEYKEYMKILSDAKKRIHEAPSIPNILKKSIKPNGKYIYFCPPLSEDGTNDIETVKKQAMEWLKTVTNEENIVFYTTTSDMGKDGKLNRKAFYDDVTLDGEKVDNKLRVMFAINQYNEGIHAPNIDGVIMGRGTTSDIVYFEQLGRALSVRGNTKEKFDELEKYSVEELIIMCKSKDIPVKENTSKEELIEKLIAPVVIDLANNYEFIKELENNLKDRIKDIQTNGLGNHRDIKISDASFDIEIENQNLFEMLMYVCDKLTDKWEIKYNYAKIYYKHHGKLEVPSKFRTNDGYTYDENGIVRLGQWITTQRIAFKEGNLSSERIRLLTDIGMRFENKINILPWEEMYKYAKIYYEHYGNLEVPKKFRTNDGYTYDENGIVRLGEWITKQRSAFKEGNLSSERIRILTDIGMRFENEKNILPWEEMHKYAKIYYEHYGNLEVPFKFRTNDGYTYDENGTLQLGRWITTQRSAFKEGNLSSERIRLLTNIGMRFENKKNILSWKEMYKYAKIYYEHYGNLEVHSKFRTNDGYTYDENGKINLGIWITTQRSAFKEGNLSSERIRLLTDIGMRFENKILPWEEMYKYAKIYYEHYGNLEVPFRFRTNDGYTSDENGIVRLGEWIKTQRSAFKEGNLSSERIRLLTDIGMRFENKILPWEEMYKYAKTYYEHYGNLEVPSKFRTNDGYTYDENGTLQLGRWITTQRSAFKEGNLSSERIRLLTDTGMRFENKILPWEEMYKYAKIYYEHYGNLEVSKKFRTNDGYTSDENGTLQLGKWINKQRSAFKEGNLSSERIRLLTNIGMVWNIKKNKEDVINICLEYNIDTIKNKSIIEHISIQELKSKIEFLKAFNIKLVDENGLLIDIFSISSIDMKEKYNVSLEELINNYYVKDVQGKGV